jgi:hypothetical protein
MEAAVVEAELVEEARGMAETDTGAGTEGEVRVAVALAAEATAR